MHILARLKCVELREVFLRQGNGSRTCCSIAVLLKLKGMFKQTHLNRKLRAKKPYHILQRGLLTVG